MKTKLYIFTFAFLITSTLRAEFSVEAFAGSLQENAKNAPAIVALTALENPKSLIAITAVAVTALPDQTLDIVRALLKAAPKQAVEIVRAAISAQPKLSAEIAAVAAATLPAQADEITNAAIAAATEDMKARIAAALPVQQAVAAPSRAPTPTARVFPTQPIRPDLVSPSGDAPAATARSTSGTTTVTPPR